MLVSPILMPGTADHIGGSSISTYERTIAHAASSPNTAVFRVLFNLNYHPVWKTNNSFP